MPSIANAVFFTSFRSIFKELAFIFVHNRTVKTTVISKKMSCCWKHIVYQNSGDLLHIAFTVTHAMVSSSFCCSDFITCGYSSILEFVSNIILQYIRLWRLYISRSTNCHNFAMWLYCASWMWATVVIMDDVSHRVRKVSHAVACLCQ